MRVNDEGGGGDGQIDNVNNNRKWSFPCSGYHTSPDHVVFEVSRNFRVRSVEPFPISEVMGHPNAWPVVRQCRAKAEHSAWHLTVL